MQTKMFQKVMALICAAILLVSVLPAGSALADEKPGTPSITVKAVNDTDVKVTIGKTSGVDFFEVWVTSDCGYMGYKNANSEHPYSYEDDPGNYINAAKVEKDGTAVRYVTVKNLTKGEVSVKVRGVKYRYRSDGTIDDACDADNWYYGNFSKAKSVKVKSSMTGYKTSYNFSNVKVGDIIKFGSYEQDYPVNGKDPIEWVVIDKKKEGLFIISKYALDCLPYNALSNFYYDQLYNAISNLHYDQLPEIEDTTWAECTLREWLNKKFYNSAFNSSEKKMIRNVLVRNEDSPYYKIEGGKDTKDKVFLLSLSEVIDTKYGFDADTESDINRTCAPTDYAAAQGAKLSSSSITADNIASCRWWLRSPGNQCNYAANINYSGSVTIRGHIVCTDDEAVRPAMWIKLKSE